MLDAEKKQILIQTLKNYQMVKDRILKIVDKE